MDTIQQAAAAVVLLIAICGFLALILGAWLTSRVPPPDGDALDDRSAPLRVAGTRSDAQPLQEPFRTSRLRAVRGDHASGLASRPQGATVLSLPVTTRLDRQAHKYAQTRRVNPFGIGGDVS